MKKNQQNKQEKTNNKVGMKIKSKIKGGDTIDPGLAQEV